MVLHTFAEYNHAKLELNLLERYAQAILLFCLFKEIDKSFAEF